MLINNGSGSAPSTPPASRFGPGSPPAKDGILDLQRVRVLVIDDNLFARRLMRIAMNSLGIRQIAEAGGALEGIAAVRTFAPDLIIVDWEMEPLDGLTFIRDLRRNEDLGARCTPIILSSGHSEQWRVLAARDAGANEYIVKPFTVKSVYAKIRSLVDNPRAFIEVPSGFFGPDRRRRSVQVDSDRRSAAGRSRSLVEVDFDRLLAVP